MDRHSNKNDMTDKVIDTTYNIHEFNTVLKIVSNQNVCETKIKILHEQDPYLSELYIFE